MVTVVLCGLRAARRDAEFRAGQEGVGDGLAEVGLGVDQIDLLQLDAAVPGGADAGFDLALGPPEDVASAEAGDFGQ